MGKNFGDMIKEIKRIRFKKDINEYLNSLNNHKYYQFGVCDEELYTDVNGEHIINIIHDDAKLIYIKINKIPHFIEVCEYAENNIIELTKCHYKIKHK